ncbi:MAG TPA: DUF72 domain-containing protein [Terriglobales bacterium]|nr:DUF72 domain-containing protein [Terriglobales bacterium]
MANVHIGTSGWHYKHWRGPFYPEKLPPSEMLSWYVRYFDTVEINNSFYKLPNQSTFANWRDSTPKHFLFAVKASRFLTHNKKLKDPENALHNFLPRAQVLGRKLGPILFQLPPSWRLNLERLREFLDVLPGQHRYAFEFREPSWNDPQVYDTLRRHNAALCIFELGGYHSPIEVTADFTYVRLHGPGNKYQGSYPHQILRNWADRIAGWQSLRDVYVYFDNDQAGYAVQNALELKRMVTGSRLDTGKVISGAASVEKNKVA